MARTLVLAILMVYPSVAAMGAEPDATKADLDAFKKYLAEKHPGKKWQTGPARIDGDAIRAAYGKSRFYYTFSAPPLPPGAALPELIKRHQEAVADIAMNHVSITVRIDADGKITPLLKPEDFSVGLMPIKTDDDAKTAGAAVMSLKGQDRVAPAAVSAKDVKVTKLADSWTCRLETNFMSATVHFDAHGRCKSVSKHYAGPLPPSAPPPAK